MYEIIPDLWICQKKLLKDINMNNILHINCEHFSSHISNYKKYDLHIRESIIKKDIVSLYTFIKNNIDLINTNLLINKVVIVSCADCDILSPLMICCFLIKFGKLDIQESILCLESKTNIMIKEDIFFNFIIKKIYNDSKK